MFGRLKHTLLNLFRTMLGIEMHPLRPTVLPKESQPITPYCEKLFLLKELDGINELRTFRVVRVRAFKSKAVSRHEYVCATVVDSKNETTLVAIERGRAIPNVLPIPILTPIPTPITKSASSQNNRPPRPARTSPFTPFLRSRIVADPQLALPMTRFFR